MVSSVVPPALPPPKPPDPSLLGSTTLPPGGTPPPPPTTIYSGGAIPGQQVPAAPAQAPPDTAGALSRLQAAYKQRTGTDMTPEVQEKLLRGEALDAPAAAGGAAPPPQVYVPRGLRSLSGQATDAATALTRAQTADVTTKTGIAQKAEARAERESREKATGYTGGEPITAEDLNINVAGIFRGEAGADQELLTQATEAARPLLTAMGYDLNTEAGAKALDDLLHGKAIVPPRMRTIDAQKTISEITNDTRRVNLAGREVTVGEKNAEWQKIIDRAKLTGDFIDPKTGLSTDTMDKWQMQLAESGVSGIYQGSPTFQAKMATWEQNSQDKAIFGYDRVDESGNVTHVYGTNELQLAVQKNDQGFQKALLAGFDYMDEDGEVRHIKGQQELITDERQFAERVRTGYDQVRYVYATDGNGNTQVDANGEPVLKRDANGNPIPVTDGQGNFVIDHIEGTQELSARLADRTAELQERGMELDDAQRTANREWEERRYGGYYKTRTVNLDSLGFSGTIPPAAMGSYDAFSQWIGSAENAGVRERMAAALGHAPTATELQQLFRGENVAISKAVTKEITETVQTATGPKTVTRTVTTYEPAVDYIEGEAGLEVARNNLQLTLQQNGIKADVARQVADQDYQDKVRNGYYTTGADGTPKWIYGTQEFESTEAEKQRQWTEDQRVGYERQMPNADGSVSTVHVKGIQEFEKDEADRAEALTKAGWTAEAAQERARWENTEKTRNGYFEQRPNPTTGKMEVVWHEGDEAHESELSRLAREHDVSMQDARIAAASSESRLNRMHDRWMQNRAQQYQREGYNRADALAAANREWQTGENALERTLRTSLTEMELTASENRLEAEGRMQLLATGISALATIGTGIAGLVFDGADSVGAWFVNGILNGDITAENFGEKVKTKMGLTAAEAAAAGTAVKEGAGAGADAAADGAMRGMPGQQLTGTGPAATFGSQLAGVAVPVAVVAAGIYTGYQIGKGLYNEEKREDSFDKWYATELPPSQRAEFRAAISAAGGSWGDDRGTVFDLMKGYQEMRASGADLTAAPAPTFEHRLARDLVFKMEEMQAQDSVRIAAGIRNLADRGVFPADGKYNVGNLTRAQKSDLLEAWSRMPADYRKTELPETMWKRPIDKWSVSNEQLEAIRNDVAQYGVDNGVRSSVQLSKDITDTVTKLGPKIAQISSALNPRMEALGFSNLNSRISKLEGKERENVIHDWAQLEQEMTQMVGGLSLDEENTVRSLWLQRGGDPRIPLAIQITQLVPPTTSPDGADRVSFTTNQWKDFFTVLNPKIGDKD